jgi:hypothetical protein
MSPAPGTLSDAAHEEEVARQKEIAEQLVVGDAEAPEEKGDEAPEDEAPEGEEDAPVEPEVQPVAIVPAEGATFPLRVTAVGVEDELVFESADSVVEVAPEVAEQLTYSPAVEVEGADEEDEA